jgi:hypothetical protein
MPAIDLEFAHNVGAYDDQLDLRPTDPSGKSLPQLKVWWIPQVPGKPFEVLLSSFAQAKTLLEALAQYDLFQLAHNIKPDYCNAGGLMIWDASAPDENGDCWTDFNTDEGSEIDTLTMNQCFELDAKWEPPGTAPDGRTKMRDAERKYEAACRDLTVSSEERAALLNRAGVTVLRHRRWSRAWVHALDPPRLMELLAEYAPPFESSTVHSRYTLLREEQASRKGSK